MRRTMMLAVCAAAMAAWTSAAQASDCKGCAPIKATGQGFCDHCGSGKIYGINLASRKLYDELAGDAKAIDELKESSCPGCKSAATAKAGACKHCKVFVANGRVFRSPTAYVLARGDKVDLSAMKCEGCKTAAKAQSTCKHCKTSFVADHAYSTVGFQAAAKKALETVKAAVKDAAHCEDCAVARVSDGKCGKCKIAFEHGKPVS